MELKNEYEPKLMEMIGKMEVDQGQKEWLLTNMLQFVEEQVKAEKEEIVKEINWILGKWALRPEYSLDQIEEYINSIGGE